MRAGKPGAREGQDRPRWRAKLRHRHDEAPPPARDAYRELAAWIDARDWTTCDVATIEALDLTAFLRDTTHIDLPPTERLRKLAIALEPSMIFAEQPRGWLALERIYLAGRALDPQDADIETSRAITAGECVSSADDRPEILRRILRVGREAARRGIELRPDDARAHYALGMLDYSFRHGSIEAALACFERAIEVDPTFGWARLYRAHCLHDLERWAEAVAAYSVVDPAFLVGNRAWRYDLLREQRAFCLLQAGERDRALTEFLGVLERYEQQPKLTRYQLLKELSAAAEGPLRAELSDRLARLKHAVDRIDEPDPEEGDE